MKSSFIFVAALSVLASSSLAWGQERKADRLLAQSQKLATIETQLNAYDHQMLERYLFDIDQMLLRYQPGVAGMPLACVSNGELGSHERFKLLDPATNTAIGKETAQAICKQLSSTQNHGLICVSNGELGSHERFGLYDLGRKQAKGGLTDLQTCLKLVTSARHSFMCTSNGELGSHELFLLYNRQTNTTLGGATQLDKCHTSMPN